ncbi:MAG: hypothetical protein ACYCYG_08650, partial [Bellilinea sp.]
MSRQDLVLLSRQDLVLLSRAAARQSVLKSWRRVPRTRRPSTGSDRRGLPAKVAGLPRDDRNMASRQDLVLLSRQDLVLLSRQDLVLLSRQDLVLLSRAAARQSVLKSWRRVPRTRRPSTGSDRRGLPAKVAGLPRDDRNMASRQDLVLLSRAAARQSVLKCWLHGQDVPQPAQIAA